MFQPIELEVFQQRTSISDSELVFPWDKAKLIVAFRDIGEIQSIQVMPEAYLEKLIRNTTLAGPAQEKVYANCKIKRARIDPHNVLVGQTFVERPKYEKLLENLTDSFKGFCVNRGLTDNIYVILCILIC